MKRENQLLNKKVISIIKFSILISILVVLPLYIYFFQRELITNLSNFENIKGYFENNKFFMGFVYVGTQALQIIISIIPGQWLQIGAGYFYGIPIAYILSVVGGFIGSVTAYYIAKYLGQDAMELFFGKNKLKVFVDRLNSKRAFIIIFLIFLIPGVPKDLCTYAAGLSNMKVKPFIFISLVGRTPGMLGSIVIGRQLFTGSYIGAIIIGVLAIFLFVLGIVFRKKLNDFLDGAYDKYIEKE